MNLDVTPEQIKEAEGRIRPFVRRTPLLEVADPFDAGFDMGLKLDFTQPTGSFKVRGAFSLLTARQPAGAVTTASGGNFGIAVAYASQTLGYEATVFVPETSPPEKVGKISHYGAAVTMTPGHYLDALAQCERFSAETGAFMAHAYDQDEVVAGQGTAAREISEQLPGADGIVVAVGGGGLIAGIASWCRGSPSVIAAEPDRCQSYHAALREGERVLVEVGGVAASSLGAAKIGEYAWQARRLIDSSVLVDDEAIVKAQRWLWRELRIAVEPSAATTVAALMTGSYRPEAGSTVVAMLSGANFDPSTL